MGEDRRQPERMGRDMRRQERIGGDMRRQERKVADGDTGKDIRRQS